MLRQVKRLSFLVKLKSVPAPMMIFTLLLNSIAQAKPISQELYEEHIQMRCADASTTEVSSLKSCLNSPTINNLGDLDRTAEYVVFKPIADLEVTQDKCLLNQAQQILTNKDVQSMALLNTCSKLVFLKHNLDQQAFLKKWLETYSDVNDRTMRIVPDDEFRKNEAILKELQRRLDLSVKMESAIRDSDSLLSSPHVYAAMQSRFKNGILISGDTADQARQFLQKNMAGLLGKDVAAISSSKKFVEDRTRSGTAWLDDDALKQDLWMSGSRQTIMDKFDSNEIYKRSTYCRMEGRYGKGAKIRDTLATLGTFTFGYGVGVLGKLATAINAFKSAEVTTAAVRIALGIDVASTITMGAKQTYDACREKIGGVSDKKSCEVTDSQQFKNLYFNEVQARNCALTAAASLFSAGVTVYRAAGVLESLPNDLGQGIRGEYGK